MISPDVVSYILDVAKKKGATEADVLAFEQEERSASVRLGAVEKVTACRSVTVQLRAFLGKRVAFMKTSDVSREALDALVEKTYAMLAFSEEDAANGLPDPRLYPQRQKRLELFDRSAGSYFLKDQIDEALRMERAARAYDWRITNTEESVCDVGFGAVFYGSSAGFLGKYKSSHFSRMINVIAQSQAGMQTAYWHTTGRHRSMLDEPERVGEVAARRALQQLGGRKIKTTEAPVVFDPICAARFLGTLRQAIDGGSLYRGASFLCGRLGEIIASPLVTVCDDSLIPRLLGSRPFDWEGVASRSVKVVEAGRFTSYLLDCYSARKLGMETTGNAGNSNFFLEKGSHSPQEIIASVKQGLYVVELMGHGTNVVSGDCSVGARGLWIENGKLTYPVEEITIAENLKNMLMGIEMVGNDLDFRSQTASPTLKVSRMTIGGD